MKERAVYLCLPAGGFYFLTFVFLGSNQKNIRKYEDEIALSLQHTYAKSKDRQ